MKKSIAVASFLGFASLITTPMVMADPVTLLFSFTCPKIVGEQALVNDGKQISGKGVEKVNGEETVAPLFVYDIPEGANIPTDLGAYVSSGTSFDDTVGSVSCSYSSEGEVFDSFTVSYAANIDNGTVQNQTNDSIDISRPVGKR